MLWFICFIIWTQTAAQLDPTGLNVCRIIVEQDYRYYVNVVYQAVEYYETCCGFTWPTCWDDCTKSRTVQRVRVEPRIRRRNVTLSVCCSGYAQEGDHCPHPICDKPCVHGVCVAPNQCECRPGYEGETCSQDIDECKINNGGCEQVCHNYQGTYACACKEGFTRATDDEKRCDDVNECTVEGICSCSNDTVCTATCRNQLGSYECLCSKGFEAIENRFCNNINECHGDNGNCSQLCFDSLGSYDCACYDGYKLNTDQQTCDDINECLQANGGCDHTCQNTVGSFYCECNEGYTLDENGETCSDRNECLTSDHGCEYCQNRQGSYICACPSGYHLNNDNKTCSDTNECLETLIKGRFVSLSGCSQICTNNNGSFECSCNEGYKLYSDNKTCEDVDECSLGTAKCGHICVNVIGSYICRCKPGYSVGDDHFSCVGFQCEDIPPISNGAASCLSGRTGDVCTFNCSDGFTLEGSRQMTCQSNQRWNGSVPFCKRKSCPDFQSPRFSSLALPCHNFFESTCQLNCIEGYTRFGPKTMECSVSPNGDMLWRNDSASCEKSTACTPNPCKHSGKCIISADGFSCSCRNTGYKGQTCQIGIVKTPQIPLLTENIIRRGISIQAKPIVKLNVEIISSDSSLIVTPANITLTDSTTSVDVSILGKKAGFYILTFILSEADAEFYEKPPNSIVYVIGKDFNTSNPMLPDGSLAKGCFVDNKLEVKTYSNSEWSPDGSSNGIIQIEDMDGNRVPLSFSGGMFTNETFNGFELEKKVTEKTSSSPSTDNNKECFEDNNPSAYIGSLLNENTFLYSVVRIFNSYSPYWIKLAGPIKIDNFASRDLGGNLFNGKELIEKRSACTKGLILKPDQLYYLYQTDQSLTSYFVNKNVSLPISIQKCFVKSLSTSNVHFVIIPDLANDTNIQSFSNALTNLLRLNGTFDRVGFTLNGKRKVMFSYGSSEFAINSRNQNLYLAVNGIFSWTFSNITNIFSPSLIEQSTVSDGTIDLQIQWMAAMSQQSVMFSGKAVTVVFNHTLSNTGCNESGISGVVADGTVKLSTIIDNIITFNQKGPMSFTARYSENHQVIDQPIDNLVLLKSSLREHKQLEEIKVFLNSITNEPSNVMESISGLIPVFDHIITKSRLLADSIDTLSVNEKAVTIVAIRLSYLNALKRFHILLNRYLEVDFLDNIGMEIKFNLFQGLVTKKLTNLPYIDENYFSQSLSLKQFTISGNGMICIQSICFDESNITISHGSSCDQKISDHTTVLNGVTSVSTLFGGLIRINVDTTIVIELPESMDTSTATFNASIFVYGENKSVPVSIRDSNVTIPVEIGIFKDDKVHLRITASIVNLGKTDPVLFNVNGMFKKPSKLFEDVTKNIQQKLKNRAQTIDSRLLLINLNEERTSAIAQRESITYHQNRRKLLSLVDQLTSLSRNISIAESNYNIKQREFAKVANESELSMEYRKLRAKLLKECSPQVCLSQCIPGAVLKACQSESYAYLVQQNCSSVYQKVDTFELVLVNKTGSYTGIDVETRCRTKCPPLTGFFKKLFGKRKRRGLLKVVAVKGLAVAFKNVGGTEGAIGAGIGGLFFGPVGAAVGGLIGSIFGSCNSICDAHFNPKTKHYHLSRYEQIPKQIDVKTFELCENKLRRIKIGFGISEPCQSYSKCANTLINSQCVSRNQQCAELHANLSRKIPNPKYQQSYEAFSEAGMLLSLLRRKQNVLLQRKLSLQELADISKSSSLLANESRNLAVSAKSDFLKQISGEMKLINAYKSNENLMEVRNVSFSFDILGGMKFPNRILMAIASTYNSTNIIYSNSFFDIRNYPAAIEDTTDKMIQDVVSHNVRISRKRRSLSEEPEGSQLNMKCLKIENAALEIYDIARSLTEHINKYSHRYTEYIKYKTNSKQEVMEYSKALKSQTSLETTSYNVGILVKELAEDIETQNKEALTNQPWSESLQTFFQLFDIKFEANDYNKCFGFTDCVEYHLQTILALVKHEQNEIADNATYNIPFWNRTILTLYNELPPLDKAKNLTALLVDSIVKTHPKDLFCGKSPVIDVDLSGEIKGRKHHELEIKIRLAQSIHEVDITWKKENLVIVNQHSEYLKIIATEESSGYYTCEIENKFGKTYCGKVLVTVYTKPVFDHEPENVTVYMNSPDSTYINCSAVSTPPPKFEWYFKNFVTHATQRLTETEPVLMINKDTVERSGYYYCIAYNDMHMSKSRTAIVNVLSTTTAIERILVSFNIKRIERQKRSDPLSINTNNMVGEQLKIKTKLASVMNTSLDSVANLDYQNTTATTAEISFELLSKNFTDKLIQSIPVPSWNKISNDIVKERETLFLRSLLLFYESNRTTLAFNLENGAFAVDPDSIAAEGMKVACPTGQVVLNNGYICGDCPAGTRYDEDEDKCVDCERNKYNSLPRQMTCISCPNEWETASEKSVSQLQCEAKPTESSTTTRKPEASTKATVTEEQDDGDDDLIKIIVPIVCVLFVLIIAGVIIFLTCRRKQKEKNDIMTSRENPTFDMDDENVEWPYATVSGDISKENAIAVESSKPMKQEKVGIPNACAAPNHYESALQFENLAYANSLKRQEPTLEQSSSDYDHLTFEKSKRKKAKHYEESFQPIKLRPTGEQKSEYDHINRTLGDD